MPARAPVPSLDVGDARLIIATAKDHGVLRNALAYMLATAWHETAFTMKPVREAFWLSEAWRKKNLRYWPHYGRGYVMLTWPFNYQKAEDETGAPISRDLDLAMDPKLAAIILVVGMTEGWFTKKRLDRYVTLSKSDFRNARRVVNGMDRADAIAGYARQFDALLLAEGYGVDAPSAPVPSPEPEGFVAALKAFLAALKAWR